MKRLFLLILFSPTSLLSLAQQNNSSEISSAIRFPITENAPVLVGCESLSGESERRRCTLAKVKKHITDNFNLSVLDSLLLEAGKHRIYIQFKFGADGKIHDIKTRSENKILNNEAVRVVSTLPKFIPGEQHGRTVSVKYTLPISFYHKPK